MSTTPEAPSTTTSALTPPSPTSAPKAGRIVGPVAAPNAGIELRSVSRWYGNVVAVNDISFSLGPGVTGLLGPNGAGKSTLLHLMSGFLRPSAGEVRVAGGSAWRRPGQHRLVGFVPEREAVYSFLTGFEFVRFNARLQGLADVNGAVARAIEMVDLADAQHRPVGTYSKGMRQRIKVAGALVHDPPILLLDEPFNGMDPRQRLGMMELLGRMADEGRVVLFSSHILEEVEQVARRVLVIVAGRLAASGDYRAIRKLMTDRPHAFTVRSSDDRRLATVLIEHPAIFAVELSDGLLTVRSSDFAALSRAISGLARSSGVTLFELIPTDESLDSVFAYLVQR